MIDLYWSELGCPGTLLPEYVIVEPAKGRAKRRADALILPDVQPPTGTTEPEWRHDHHCRDHPVAGQRVIVVQAKLQALSLTLLGQGVFSLDLVCAVDTDGPPSAVASVMLCTKDDSALYPFVKRTSGLSRVIIEPVYAGKGPDRLIIGWRPAPDLTIRWCSRLSTRLRAGATEGSEERVVEAPQRED